MDQDLLLAYEDGDSFPEGIAAFESLDESEVQIDDIRISETAQSNVTVRLETVARSNCDVGGALSRNEVWSGEILVASTVRVPTGVTLTIEPGTTVKFKHYRGYQDPGERCGLRVEGAPEGGGNARAADRLYLGRARPCQRRLGYDKALQCQERKHH